jgi:small subunit ribosomal protein S17
MADGKTAPVRGRRKTETGKVVSDKMEKTITVLVERRVAHPIFGKFVKHRTTLKVHDEKREAHEGDLVEVVRPVRCRRRSGGGSFAWCAVPVRLRPPGRTHRRRLP